jgi:hypothetical protein
MKKWFSPGEKQRASSNRLCESAMRYGVTDILYRRYRYRIRCYGFLVPVAVMCAVEGEAAGGYGGEPNDEHFGNCDAKQATQSTKSQKAANFQWRNVQRTPWQKESPIGEGPEECDTEAAVGHGVQHAMRDGAERDEKENDARLRIQTRRIGDRDEAEKNSKSDGMGQSSMTKRMAVGDPRPQADDIEIRKHGRGDCDKEEAARDF